MNPTEAVHVCGNRGYLRGDQESVIANKTSQVIATMASEALGMEGGEGAAVISTRVGRSAIPASTITFLPPKKDCSQVEDSTHYFYSHYYLGGSLVFKGKIDSHRFTETLRKILEEKFYFFFFRFDEYRQIDYFTTDKVAEDYKIELEVEETAETVTSFDLPKLLPNANSQIVEGLVTKPAGLPVFMLKLTKSEDDFSIGWRVTHLIDHASIVYLIKYLADIYTRGSTELKDPSLFNLDDLLSDSARIHKDLEDFQSHGESLGFIDLKKAFAPSPNASVPVEKVILNVLFDSEKMKQVIKSTGTPITENNLIMGIVFKLYCLDQSLNDKDDFSLRYVCNMRTRADLGKEALGNVITTRELKLNIQTIRENDIKTLAWYCRENSTISMEDFKKNCDWIRAFKEYNKSPYEYVPDTMIVPRTRMVDNLATFDYDSIQFNKSEMLALRVASLAHIGLSYILFDKIQGKKMVTLTLSVPKTSLADLKVLQEKEQDLFACQINLGK